MYLKKHLAYQGCFLLVNTPGGQSYKRYIILIYNSRVALCAIFYSIQLNSHKIQL